MDDGFLVAHLHHPAPGGGAGVLGVAYVVRADNGRRVSVQNGLSRTCAGDGDGVRDDHVAVAGVVPRPLADVNCRVVRRDGERLLRGGEGGLPGFAVVRIAAALGDVVGRKPEVPEPLDVPDRAGGVCEGGRRLAGAVVGEREGARFGVDRVEPVAGAGGRRVGGHGLRGGRGRPGVGFAVRKILNGVVGDAEGVPVCLDARAGECHDIGADRAGVGARPLACVEIQAHTVH